MRDFCSAAEMSRGHWNGDAEREGAGAGAAESLDAISLLLSGQLVCGAVNAFGDALNLKGQL